MTRKHVLKRIVPLLLLVILVAGGLWYTRPITILGLAPSLDPVWLPIHVRRLGPSHSEQDTRSLDLYLSDPQGQAVWEEISSLRFRRSLLNPLRQLRALFTDTIHIKGRQTADGDNDIVIHVFGDGGRVSLQFFIDEWTYAVPGEAGYLPCFVKDGEAGGNALADKLWNMGQPEQDGP